MSITVVKTVPVNEMFLAGHVFSANDAEHVYFDSGGDPYVIVQVGWDDYRPAFVGTWWLACTKEPRWPLERAPAGTAVTITSKKD